MANQNIVTSLNSKLEKLFYIRENLELLDNYNERINRQVQLCIKLLKNVRDKYKSIESKLILHQDKDRDEFVHLEQDYIDTSSKLEDKLKHILQLKNEIDYIFKYHGVSTFNQLKDIVNAYISEINHMKKDINEKFVTFYENQKQLTNQTINEKVDIQMRNEQGKLLNWFNENLNKILIDFNNQHHCYESFSNFNLNLNYMFNEFTKLYDSIVSKNEKYFNENKLNIEIEFENLSKIFENISEDFITKMYKLMDNIKKEYSDFSPRT